MQKVLMMSPIFFVFIFGFTGGLIIGIWGLIHTFRSIRIQDDEKYREAAEQRGKALLSNSYTIGQLPKEVRRIRRVISLIFYSVLVVLCTAALILISFLWS
jgi:hypothetical protein